MKIPTKIKIGPHIVRVKWFDELEGRIAQAVLPANRIEIARYFRYSEDETGEIAESLHVEALLHEIGHFILFYSGYDEIDDTCDTEHINTAYCHWFLQVIRDNKLDFRG